MANTTVLLPKHKIAIEEIAKEENFCKFELSVTKGSSTGDNYLGEIHKIAIIGEKHNGEEASLKTILKSAPSNEEVKKNIRIDLIYVREILMYSTVLPKLYSFQANFPENDKLHFAKLYTGKCEPDCQILIMEDLTEKGFIMHNRLEPLDYDHLQMVIKKLASFHATSMALKVRDPELYRQVVTQSATFSEYSDSMNTFIDILKPSIKKIIQGENYEAQVLDILERMYNEYAENYNAANIEPFDVICHGDCWSNNILFKYEDGKLADLRFLDWQMIRTTSPCSDIAYFIFTATDKEMRANHYDQLIKLYYDTLTFDLSIMGLNVDDVYPKSVFRSHLKRYMKFGVVVSTMLLPYTLSNKGESIEMGEVMKEGGSSINEVPISKTCAERLRGIFEDASEYDLF